MSRFQRLWSPWEVQRLAPDTQELRAAARCWTPASRLGSLQEAPPRARVASRCVTAASDRAALDVPVLKASDPEKDSDIFKPIAPSLARRGSRHRRRWGPALPWQRKAQRRAFPCSVQTNPRRWCQPPLRLRTHCAAGFPVWAYRRKLRCRSWQQHRRQRQTAARTCPVAAGQISTEGWPTTCQRWRHANSRFSRPSPCPCGTRAATG